MMRKLAKRVIVASQKPRRDARLAQIPHGAKKRLFGMTRPNGATAALMLYNRRFPGQQAKTFQDP
jgi:hypothetical protein